MDNKGNTIWNNQIQICEAASEEDVRFFWEQLHAYHARDIFPDPHDEERDYFLNAPEYPAAIQKLHDRPVDCAYYLLFIRDGQRIGFALPVIYTSEDGKCFLMEFGVFPEYRGQGTGKACARTFFDWAARHGALYMELNYGNCERRLRFWQSFGFQPNGRDEWGEPLLLLPPVEQIPVTVEILADPMDSQLQKLENGYLAEIGEDMLTDEKTARLQQAIREHKITFFLAKRGARAVGMCSVVSSFSTFACCETGVFEDFYIEPVFRGKGIARLLTNAAIQWCQEHELASLTVCCAPCDEAMYQALGFDMRLGTTFASLLA